MNVTNIEISLVDCAAIFVHPSISTELHYLLEHNPEFCSHTIDVWELEGFFHRWNWLGVIWWASF